MVRFETETHPCRGHGELEEPSLGGDGEESGKEQTEEGSERLSPNKGLPRTFSLCGPTSWVSSRQSYPASIMQTGSGRRECSDSAGAPDHAVGEDLGLTS